MKRQKANFLRTSRGLNWGNKTYKKGLLWIVLNCPPMDLEKCKEKATCKLEGGSFLYLLYQLKYIPLINREWGHYGENSDWGLDVLSAPWRGQYIKDEVWDFSVMTERTRLISYLLHGLFIMNLSLRSIKTYNWSADNFKKHVNEFFTWARVTVKCHWSADILFDSCHLTITWMSIRMSTIKLQIVYALDT